MGTISACMIVRDEQANLRRCLAALRPHVDEICVVDTGSTDGTPDLARELGARVRPFPWRDDFSAARNASLEMATGEWILVVDADEFLTDDSGPALREATRTDAIAYLIYQDNITDDGAVHPLLVPRLFRNRPDVRFRRPIHESVSESLEPLCAGGMPVADVHLRHEGYLAHARLSRDKLARNLRILRRHVTEDPGDLYAHYKLAVTLDGMDAARAERDRHLRVAIRLVRELPLEAARRLPFAPGLVARFAWSLADEGEPDRALAALADLGDPWPGSIEIACARGEVLRRLGRDREAEPLLRSCLGGDGSAPLAPRIDGVADALPLLSLSRIEADRGRHAEALSLCERAAGAARDPIPARADRARRLLALGDASGAAREIASLAETAATRAEVRLLLGDIRWLRGDVADARRHWDLAAAAGRGPDRHQAIARSLVAALAKDDRADARALLGRLACADVPSASARALAASELGVAAGVPGAFDADALERRRRAWEAERRRLVAAAETRRP